MRRCEFPGCVRTHACGGYCHCHDMQRRRGTVLHPVIARGTKQRCTVGGCQRTARCKGLCDRHYRRLLEYGSPLAACPIRTRSYRAEVEYDSAGDPVRGRLVRAG